MSEISEISKKINLSPSFLLRVYDKGYDYAVGEKLGLFPRVSTPAMANGRMIHALIAERLGGEKAEIAINPYDSYRTKAAKEWRDSQPDSVEITTAENLENMNKIVDRLVNHEKLKPLIEGECHTEMSVSKDVNGNTVKGVLDLVSINGEAKSVIDWKFISSQVFDSFDKKALHNHYDLQAAIYDFLVEPTHVYFVAIENEVPNRIKLFYCDPSFLDSGAEKFDKTFKILQEANWREPRFNIEEVGTLMSWGNYNG